MSGLDDAKRKLLREILKQLPSGAHPQEIKERFGQVLKGVTSEDIVSVEKELVSEGVPREELQKLCDIHMAVFGEQVQEPELMLPRGHPISILMEEHRVMLQRSERLRVLTGFVADACDSVQVGDEIAEIKKMATEFQDSESHYRREENVLFPLIERHGVSEPPAVMWTEHNRIREVKKNLINLTNQWNKMAFEEFKSKLSNCVKSLCDLLPSHFYKENNILFPMALQTITVDEWEDARNEFDELGYCCFTPPEATSKFSADSTPVKPQVASHETLMFDTGKLSKEEIEGIMDALPIDISFVDADDSVKYFNKAEKRIFVRTKAVLGRKVELCHPQKSVHVVEKIIESFRSGRKNSAEFWITLNDLLVHIRYFAVRDKDGKYLGTMEVTQNLTDIKKIEGEKRLLDWTE